MSYQFLNLHPDGKIVRDCVKRALSFCSDISYNEVSLMLNRLKKETGCKKFNEDKNWKKFVKNMGWEKLSFPVVKGYSRMNGERFCEYYPKGTYLLRMAHHLSVCKDGVIYDIWNCSEKCVYNAWRVK